MLLSHPSDGAAQQPSPQESASLGSEEDAVMVSANDEEEGFRPASQSVRAGSSADKDKVRALLDRIKDDVRSKQEQQVQGDKTKVSVELSEEDILLLTGLLENGTIDRSSKLASALESSMREMTMVQHAHLISRVKGDGHWPVNVGFRDITYSVNVPTKDLGLTNVANAMVTPIVTQMDKSGRVDLPIINGVSGSFEAGKSTLVLGPPGCGVTTLFKILSGRAKVGGPRKLSGDIFYSGFRPEDLHVRKLSTYVDQNDNHIPVLTVRETLQFAYNCFGGPDLAQKAIDKVGISAEASDEDVQRVRDEFENFPDFVIRNLALSNAADTIVGNDLLRGVSGGEKKRVTSAEMMMAQRPLAFYDQISTGLDSSATFDICRRITGVAKRLDLTPVCALLQPPPETYALFDEIMVLALGYVVYHGPRENVLPYFESIGFTCPEEMDVADFIQEVTTPDRRKYQTRSNAPADEKAMADAWAESPYSERQRTAMERYCNPDNVIDSDMRRDLYASDAPVYSNPFFKEMAMVVKRQVSLAFRDIEFVRTRIIQAVVVGVYLGSLFFQLNPQLPTSASEDQTPTIERYGILFATFIHSALAGASQIPVVLTQRPVFYKQSDSFFFRTVNYVIAEALSVLPMAFVETTLLSVTAFWIAEIVPWGENSQTGEPSDVGGCFMLYWFLMLILNISTGAFLRALASLSPSPSVGQVMSGLCIASVCIFSGYILTFDTIPPWFIWIYWLSPTAWGFRAGVLTIFTSNAFTREQQDYALQLFGIERDTTYIWAGILWLIGYTIVSLCASYVGYVYLRFDGSGGSGGRAVPDSDTEERNDPDVMELERVLTERSASELNREPNIKAAAAALADPSSSSALDFKSSSTTRPDPASSEEVDLHVESSLNKRDFIPADLEFRNLWYSVKRPGDKRGTYSLSLLKGITGFAEAGTLTALMGSSGAGKSTLMDVLALRKTGGRIEGEVLVNGRPQDKTTFSRIIGYVEQNDIHSPKATVHEALIFSAFLRQPSDIPRAEKEAFVEQVIETLRLEPIRDRPIGFKSAGGLSTEQAKRLTIGVELAANPAIIFADEPTSGLDASSARVVMDGIERIARSGRTVVCTIHQPSKAIFTKFDRLLLLRRGGEMVYFGDLGKDNCDDLLTYLNALPGTTGMPNPRYNPATYMLEAIGANAGPGVDYAQLYRDGDLKKENDHKYDALVQRNLDDRPEITFDSTFASTFAMQTEQLTLRWFRSYWRDPAYNTTRFVVAVVAALYFGLAFLMQGSNLTTVQDIQGLVGLLFMASAFLSFMSQNTVLPTVLIERAPFYRERAASYYGVAPLVIATTVSELPYIIAAGLVFVSIFYFIAGLWANASAFFLFWGFYTLFNMIITFWGHFLASALPNDQVANLVAAVVFSCWCFAAGLMIAISDVPYFWQWFTYINPLRYSLNGLVVSQLSCEDPSSELAGNPGCSVLETGETAWEYTKERFGYAADDIGFCLGACFGFAVGIRILNIFSYKYISYLKR